MFRSIGGTLDKKKKYFTQVGERSADINVVFDDFLSEFFAEYKVMFKWEASYSPQDGKVIINTGNKLIAGELSLKIKELARLLKKANFRITQIVIA